MALPHPKNRVRRPALIIIFFWPLWLALLPGIAPASARAAMPLADYHERVGRALSVVRSLLPDEDEEGAVRTVEAEKTTAAFRALRETLPPQLTVAWEGGSLEVDNAWLEAALEEYEKEAPGRLDEENRLALERISGRLHALDLSLAETEESLSTASAAGGEDRARLEAILRRLEGDRQKQEATALARLQAYIREILSQILEWLRELIPDMPRLPANNESGGGALLTTIARLVIYALVLALLGLLAWKFGPTALKRLRRKRESRPAGARVVLGELVEADETAADLLAEAEALARAGEPRAAVRKAYIALLCELGDQKILHLAQHKTNRDYLRALEKRPRLYAEVSPLTHHYERFWYGAEPTATADWTIFSERCRQAFALARTG